VVKIFSLHQKTQNNLHHPPCRLLVQLAWETAPILMGFTCRPCPQLNLLKMAKQGTYLITTTARAARYSAMEDRPPIILEISVAEPGHSQLSPG
jgi:hypothetical protein